MPVVVEKKEFKVGTSGWTVDDLDDPRIERAWLAGRHEIVEGVLAEMPAAYFDGGRSLLRLIDIVTRHVRSRKLGGDFAVEADVVLTDMRVPIADALCLNKRQLVEQRRINQAQQRPRGEFGRIRVVPTLVIESISPGHELHDVRTKRGWYGEAGVPNYWLLNAFEKRLECLVLAEDEYVTDVAGRRADVLRPRAFSGLTIRLARLWST